MKEYYHAYVVKRVKENVLKNKLLILPIIPCPECGTRLKYTNLSGKTNIFCSPRCAGNSEQAKEKKKQTNLKKYGVEQAAQNKDIYNKVKATNLKKYGAENATQNKEIKNKIKETNIERYGAENPMQNKDIQNKVKETNIKKYGVEYIGSSKEVQNKKIKTNLKKYGVKHSCENPDVKNKKIETNLKKYGTKHSIENIEVRRKTQKTNIKKYGSISPFGNKEVQLKGKNTVLKKYGVNNIAELYSIREKIVNTNLKKYGVKYTSQIQEVLDKMRNTRKNNTAEKYNNNCDGNFINNNGVFEYTCDICKRTSVYEGAGLLSNRFIYKAIFCSYCLPKEKQGINQRSSIEIKLEEAIKKLGIKTEHKTDLDIFLPDYNIGIEVNGVYWHSTKHKDKLYHRRKLLKLKEQGIQLFSFSDYDLNIKFNIILNYIKGKLGLLPAIGASKCKISKITPKESREFCEKYHVHGFVGGITHYGLKLKGELVSICIVGKSRFDKTTLEIIRLTNSCKVIGGFGRFLKQIKIDFPEYKNITTFINGYLGVSDNNVFTKNGFKFISYTEPNYYWYMKSGTIKLSRQQCQKHKLIKKYGDKIKNIEKLTETEIMEELKGLKVYDAGNYKFTLTN